MTARRRSTLDDVARAAGVHPSTVSRALGRPDLVTPETRQRVEAAALELDYVPNVAARSLVRGRTGALGVLVPDIANPYFAALVQAAQAEATAQDRVVLLTDTRHIADHERRALAALRPQVDGIILCTPVADDHSADGGPLVFVNRRSRGVNSVTVDQAAVVRLAFEHLHGLGHRHIVWLNGPSSYWSSRERDRALTELVGADAGVRHDVVPDVDPTFEGGWKASEEAFRTGATGVVAFNDLMALGVLAAAGNAGIAVPSDISIVGSDDVQVASMSWPQLTSVASPLDSVGRLAVQLLLSSGESSRTRHRVLQPGLSVRGSTGPAPQGR